MRDLEAIRIRNIHLNAVSQAHSLQKLTEETVRWEKLFCSGKHPSYCQREAG